MQGNIYAYHRISTTAQHLDRGISELKEYFSKNNIILTRDIFCDMQTGKNFSRPAYLRLKKLLKERDTIYITEMDRLGRDKKAILRELRELQEKGVCIRILELPTTLVDYSNLKDNEMAKMMMETIGNMLIELYASFAEAEMHKREKRQIEGIAAMKERGEWERYGRPRKVSKIEFEKACKAKSKQEILKEYDICKSTFYRYKKEISLDMNMVKIK